MRLTICGPSCSPSGLGASEFGVIDLRRASSSPILQPSYLSEKLPSFYLPFLDALASLAAIIVTDIT